MRLLNVITRKLESFDNEYNIPLYAILSHTWGDEEVLFNHMAGSDDTRREGEKREGYAKIVGACEQAIEDGLGYIWIDTCCINKESSAELSEAINSMYKWYRKAEVCYVYLEDVYSSVHYQEKIDEDIKTDGSDAEGSPVRMVPFERSRWFSRGWTLQELLAPQYVVFYSRDWVDIGTRASLQDVISARTHIRVEMLMAYDPKRVSVAERMSWAAYRETTRKEDIAYCLMGLFGVNMPLLYGEGNKAFRRLQEEIMKVSDDHSLFAWKGRYSDYAALDSIFFPLIKNYKAQGMLANSPWNFRDGADIAPSDDAYSPYSMTNQGLQIQLPLQPIDPKRDLPEIDPDYCKDIFKATLKCTIRDNQIQPRRWIVIYLKLIRKGYYQRVFAHWLDMTEINPNENELASLVVPQADTFTTNDAPGFRKVKMKTLPTESGFTTDGHSLVEGYEHPGYEYTGTVFEFIRVTLFDGPEGECFAAVIGSKDSLFWLDVIDVNKEWSPFQPREMLEYDLRQAYQEGGPQYDKVLRHSDRLSMKILDWSVVVSAKKFNNNIKDGCHLCVTVDIQRKPTLSRGWYTTPSDQISTSVSFSGGLETYLHGHDVVHPEFKKERGDWIAIFNPKAERALDVNPLHSIQMCRPLHTMPNEGSGVNFVQFSPDGKRLAVRYYLGRVLQVYDINTGEPCILFGGESTIDCVSSVCFSPDGKFLAIGSDGEKIVFWNIKKRDISKVLRENQYSDGLSISLCFSLDSRLIVSGSDRGTIQIWNIANETSHTFTTGNKSSVQAVTISPNCRLVAGGCSPDTIYIWDIATKQLVKKLEGYDKVVFTSDGERLVIGGDYGLGSLDVGKLTPSQALEGMKGSNGAGPNNNPRVSETSLQIIYELSVTSVTVSCGGHWVISGSTDGSVQVWNLEEGTAQFLLQGHTGLINSVDMSPVSNIFATSSLESRRVRVWCYDAMKMKEGKGRDNDTDIEKNVKKKGI